MFIASRGCVKQDPTRAPDSGTPTLTIAAMIAMVIGIVTTRLLRERAAAESLLLGFESDVNSEAKQERLDYNPDVVMRVD